MRKRSMVEAQQDGLAYMHGFGNEFESEALPGALPTAQNNPRVRRKHALLQHALPL